MPKLAVPQPLAAAALDPRTLFPDAVAAVWVEVGFGTGEHLARLAKRYPDIGFIGCEPYRNGVASLLARIADAGLGNIRIHPDDARPLLDALRGASVGRVFALFPDPWPKTRHHKRRFIGPRTVETLARILAPGGLLQIATDHEDYCRWSLLHLALHPAFEWTARRPADWRSPPADWVATRYEQKARAADRPVVYLCFRRQSAAPMP